MKAIHKKSILRPDNSGVTLLELVLVLAIMGILAGLSGVGISLMYSRDCEKCARIIDEAMEEARRRSMTMQGTFELRLDAAAGTLQINSSEKGIIYNEALPGRVTVSLEALGGTEDIRGRDWLSLYFDKATGRVRSIAAEGVPDVDGTVLRIYCSSGGKTVRTVLVRATGKHYLDYNA